MIKSRKTMNNLTEAVPSLVAKLDPGDTSLYSIGTSTNHWKELWVSQHSFNVDGKSIMRVAMSGSTPPVNKAANSGYEFYFKSTVTPNVLYYYPNNSSSAQVFDVRNGSVIYSINAAQMFIFFNTDWLSSTGFS